MLINVYIYINRKIIWLLKKLLEFYLKRFFFTGDKKKEDTYSSNKSSGVFPVNLWENKHNIHDYIEPEFLFNWEETVEETNKPIKQ